MLLAPPLPVATFGVLSLLGMPGSGKSTLGRRLATSFGCPFLDLDAAIEERTGQRIPAIFKADGEAFFRQLEADTLREAATRPGPLVLATGGGTPCFHDNLAVLQAAGPTLWLDVPNSVLAARLQAAGLASRPLLAAAQPAFDEGESPLETWLRETLAARSRFYALARLHLPNPGPVDVLPAALALLSKAGYLA